MSKFLAGVFLGVFTGALVYEILKRTNPELDRKFRESVDKVIDGISGIASGNKKPDEDAASKMKSIPVN